MDRLEKEIEKAKIACQNQEYVENQSIVDKLRPWVHYNNLLNLKITKLLENEKMSSL